MSTAQTAEALSDPSVNAISRAIGEELRRAREALGLSRAQLVAVLPSGIGDRTLLSYEHGTRHLTVLRFVELSKALGIAAPTLLNQALQRSRLHLQNLALQIDLRFLLNDRSEKFRPMHQWARNKLNENPDGVVDGGGRAALTEPFAVLLDTGRVFERRTANASPIVIDAPRTVQRSVRCVVRKGNYVVDPGAPA